MTSGCPGQPQFGFEGALPAQGRWLPEGDTSPGFIVETDSVAVCLSHSPRVDRGPRRGSKVCCHTARECPILQTPFSALIVIKGVVAQNFRPHLLVAAAPPLPAAVLGGSESAPKVCPWLQHSFQSYQTQALLVIVACAQKWLRRLIQVLDFPAVWFHHHPHLGEVDSIPNGPPAPREEVPRPPYLHQVSL